MDSPLDFGLWKSRRASFTHYGCRWYRRGPRPIAPSHGENRGSRTLGSANKIKYLLQDCRLVSNNCPINVYGQAWTLMMTMPYARCAGDCQRICTGQRLRTDIRHSPAPKFQRSTSSAFSMGAMQDLDNPHESTARTIDPGSTGGPRRANNLPQRREWFLCSARQGARAS